jgi:hypothetical protein
MNAEEHNAFAVRVLKADTILNIILGVAFVAIPGPIESVLGDGPLIPFIIWRVIGVIFVLYAAWEIYVTRRPPLSVASLAFASVMALVPVVLLTAALLFLPVPLNTFGRVILWFGDGLMLVLGSYYALVIWRMRREGFAGAAS